MLRDTRKDAAYFGKYIAEQQQRIDKFAGVLRALRGSEKPDAVKILQVTKILSGFQKDLIFAEYSYGCSMALIKKSFSDYLKLIGNLDQLVWSDAIDILSLSIVLDIDCGAAIEDLVLPQDALISELCKQVRMPNTNADLLLFPEKEQVFLACLRGQASVEDLKNYVANEWYAANSDLAWYNAHLSAEDIYTGYWCFAGAAVAKISGFNKESFVGTDYFPYDLL